MEGGSGVEGGDAPPVPSTNTQVLPAQGGHCCHPTQSIPHGHSSAPSQLSLRWVLALRSFLFLPLVPPRRMQTGLT